jgi:nitrogen fixation/metabolism regulation signal transduction histidine kinase
VVKGDHTKLMQVMLNVIKNSLEAIDMESDSKFISVSMESTSEYILLKIADNGQGFDEKTSKHFFERGFTTKKKGTGLGLYNCRSIVESHAGTFDISSDGPGLGAVTTIKFALQDA